MLLFQYEAVCGCVVGTVRYDKYCAVAICDWLFKLLPESWLITGWFIYSDSISDVKYSCIRNFINRKKGKKFTFVLDEFSFSVNMLYSEKVMDHFMNPRNVGKIEDADGVGEVGNAKCGDIMKIYIKVNDGIITDVKFNTFGCGSAIASSSMATEMIKGKPVSEALELTNKAVAEALDGLPAHKLHCSVLAEEAIKAAIEDYEKKKEAKSE